ncbi:MAG: hypothetical protein JSS02_12290 [Planctomycetes bacterium]|nr:hypothetical protein [Planctomycetota bacterium]
MDPREMIYQIQSDFKSNRFAGVVFALILGLGAVCWYQALSSRPDHNPRLTTPASRQISVLPNPFEKL